MEHDKSHFKLEYRAQSGLRATPCRCFKWNGCVFLSWNLHFRKCK